MVSTGQPSLLLLFIAAMRPVQPPHAQADLKISGFVDQGGGVVEADLRGGCGNPGICRLSGTVRIEPVAPEPRRPVA